MATKAKPTFGGLGRILGVDAGPYAEVPITGLAADHRHVKPGYVFFAMPGTQRNGADFIPDAVAAGATLIVGIEPRPANLDRMTLYWRIDEPRVMLSKATAYIYAGQPRTIVAVTGTAGKTSVVEFARQIFSALGHRAASLGTLGLIGPDGPHYGALTTPDPITLHRTLAELHRAQVTHLAMEASSHGLDQHRLDDVKLAAAGFTNLGRDHLDYHADIEHYFAAKLRLFEELLPADAPAVINLDGERGAEAAVAAAIAGRRVLTIGARGQDITRGAITPLGFGQRVALTIGSKPYEVHINLMGAFQVENVLMAAGFALALGEDPDAIMATLETIRGVPGRLEHVGSFNRAPIFVDYAHKPEALEHALQALHPFVSGRTIVVFGCGGDRDAGKRPIMGRIASSNAGMVIVTDDNPRSEMPAEIRAAILKAAPGALEIGDREAAIREGILRLEPGDALLIAGKGHETGQIVGGVTHPFSDHEVARRVIRELT